MTTTAGPAWFEQAVQVVPERGHIQVDDAKVSYLAWGSTEDPTLMLVHGGAAHAHWWSPIAPFLAEGHRVVALDLTGHGDSDHRDGYRMDRWAAEVLAVADAAGGRGRPVVVGHSMGGRVTVVAAARSGAVLDGAIILDSPIRRPDPESREGEVGRMFRAPKTYPDLETAVGHFHLVPPQPSENDWLLDYIARHSLRQTADGWRWKFDPGVFTHREGPASSPTDHADSLASASCRIAIVNGARSVIVDHEVKTYMAELLAGSPAAAAGIPFVEIPEAHHHVMIDQPLAVVTAIRAVLATWRPVGTPPAEVSPA